MQERKTKIKQGKRIDSARETVLILKMVKIPSWEGDIRWGRLRNISGRGISRRYLRVTEVKQESQQTPEAGKYPAYVRNSNEASVAGKGRGKRRSQRR